LTKKDFETSKWEEIIDQCERKECYYYSEVLFKKALEAQNVGDKKLQEIYNLLGSITSMSLNPESPVIPFRPMVVMSNSRSAIVDDFSENHLEALGEIVFDISDSEIKSRFADVLWVRKKDFRFAQIAIESYLESANILEHPENWTKCADRIERAFRLSILLGSNTGYLEKVVNHIEAVLNKYDGKDPLFLSNKLMGFLIEVRKGDFQKYCSLSKKIAQEAEKSGGYNRARTYWETNAKWSRLNSDLPNERYALVQAAETHVKEAEDATSKDSASYLIAVSHLQKAIECYRRIGKSKTRIDELHQKLIDYEERSLGEMQSFSTELDLGNLVKDSINRVKGKSLQNAIFELAKMMRSPRVNDLRQQVLDNARNYPLQHIISAHVINEKGKIIAKQSGMFSNNESGVEESIQANMLKQAEFHYHIYTHSLIEPVRHQILLEHNVRISHFLDIVSNNPLVPSGREYIYAQGLQAGMEGDFVIAVHLLIPQIENSIRFILSQMGVLTSGIDSDGIQEEHNLNVTLYTPEIKKVFGENIIFDLQSLLVERLGANLRNRMAHGLMSHNSFYSIHVPYLWALVLQLCCLPLIRQKYEKAKTAKKDSTDSED
jgi:hypothetical protein